MKKILFILATVLLCSCEKTTTVYSKSNLPWQVVEIDSCEYIKDGYRLAHKGNCKYCRERNREMVKDILTAIDYE